MGARRLRLDPETVKGFLHTEEGETLYDYALAAPGTMPCLEVGSYCGRSTVYLGSACQARDAVLFAVDHHRGSEEHQPGEGYHDAALDDAQGRVDSFPVFRRTLERAGLEETVVPVVAPSAVAARAWATPLALVFVDGGHSMAAALTDYRCWAPRLAPGGVLAIHDVFPDPADGGRPPFEIWQLARRSGLFEEIGLVRSLALLRRLG